MPKAPDKIKSIAVYASEALGSGTPTFYNNYIGSSSLEDQVIAYWKLKGINFAYLSNGNISSGFLGATYTTTTKNQLKAFIQKCTNNGISVGMVVGLTGMVMLMRWCSFCCGLEGGSYWQLSHCRASIGSTGMT